MVLTCVSVFAYADRELHSHAEVKCRGEGISLTNQYTWPF